MTTISAEVSQVGFEDDSPVFVVVSIAPIGGHWAMLCATDSEAALAYVREQHAAGELDWTVPVRPVVSSPLMQFEVEP